MAQHGYHSSCVLYFSFMFVSVCCRHVFLSAEPDSARCTESTLNIQRWLTASKSDWSQACFLLPLSSAVQSRSLRSVMEVYSIQPGFSVSGDVVVPSSPHGKLLRPEYADMEPLLHNHSYRDHEHHHGDPITGHASTLSWLSHPGKDRKWCHWLASISLVRSAHQ